MNTIILWVAITSGLQPATKMFYITKSDCMNAVSTMYGITPTCHRVIIEKEVV